MKRYSPLHLAKTRKRPLRPWADRRRFLRAGAALAGMSAMAPAIADLSSSAPKQHVLLLPPATHLSWLKRGADFFSSLVSDLSAQSLQFSIRHAEATECFKQVRDGDAHACFAYLRDWRSESYARNFFAGLPGGLNGAGLIGWFYEGDGLSLWRAACEPLGLVPSLVGVTGMSLAGWFRSPLDNTDKVRGVKMRLLDVHAERVWEKAGGSAMMVRESDLLEALRTQKITAAEAASPLVQDMQPLASIAPYGYYPSWQSPAAAVVCLYNREAYQTLDEVLHAVLAVAARLTSEKMEWILTAENAGSLRRLQAHGAKLERLPAPLLARLLRLSQSLIKETIAGDEWLTQVHDSYRDFQKKLLHLHRVTESAYFQKIMTTRRP